MKKLEYSNSWEADIYTIGGKRVKKLTEVKINGKFYKVTAAVVGVEYSDHGQMGAGVSTHYYVQEKVFGLPRLFDLNTIVLKKPVYAAEYEVE